MFETVPNVERVTQITQTHTFHIARCTLGEQPFQATVLVRYKPDGKVPLFQSWEAWLHSLGAGTETVESLARLIFDGMKATLAPTALYISVTGNSIVHDPAVAEIWEEK